MRAALVLAGGRGLRLGGVDKALLDVGGATMLDRGLGAAGPHCDALVVVGPPRETAVEGVRFTMEPEAGGGPVPAVAAGLAAVPDAREVVVLAVDLPLLGASHIALLLASLPGAEAVAAADHRARPNPLLAAYRGDVLRTRIPSLGRHDRAADLLPAATVVVDLGEAGTLNVNRAEELERARRLTRPGP